MHQEIFNQNQLKLLPFVAQFKKEFYLVGGTAIALYIGHRRSIDFDLFKFSQIKPKSIIKTISGFGYPYTVTRRVTEQMNLTIYDVKFTFYQYPFKISETEMFNDILRLPKLIDLTAMKAYALGRRSKWKDYVDFYFLLKEYFTIKQIAESANEVYGQLFSEKLFRAQLTYFDDIDYTEQVEYICHPVAESDIKEFLIDIATDIY